jgi:hypothetical protein
MVCLRNISVDTLHKGDTKDDDNNNNNNNNNNVAASADDDDTGFCDRFSIGGDDIL